MEKHNYKPWWTPGDNHIPVRFKNWNINIEKILENKYLFSEEEESEDIDEETSEEVKEEVQEQVIEVPKIPLNPYAELG